MREFFNQHSGLACLTFTLIFSLFGLVSYKSGLKLLAFWEWFLSLVVLSLGIAISSLFLGLFRWPIAAIVFIIGMSLLWRFRNKL